MAYGFRDSAYFFLKIKAAFPGKARWTFFCADAARCLGAWARLAWRARYGGWPALSTGPGVGWIADGERARCLDAAQPPVAGNSSYITRHGPTH